ncbi:MAG: Fe-S protein assembly chaperone HscA [Myxococcales bacterium]|nr:Fe-S protein assembly chaperone HscA [Myxococcales bacterium]
MTALFEIFDPKAAPKPIGIDLGTTNSLVAWVDANGKPMVARDCDDVSLVPSVVHYRADGGVVVGRGAQLLASEHPRETIVSAKRYVGRGADDDAVKGLGPYDLLPRADDGPNVVRFKVHGRAVTPMEVSAEILRSLKRLAEDELRAVGGVVITVPAYFDEAQRQATKDAGRLAGLDVLRLLNEPTAAALAYGLDKRASGTFAVYDLGGGTFDVSILHLDDGVFQVKSTGGDTALGGDDMDRAIAEELFVAMGFADASARPAAIVRLVLDESRKIKHALTTSDVAGADLPHAGGAVSRVEISRERFDALIAPLLARTGVTCRRALKDAGVKPEQLDGVILVGGATRVPAVRAYVAKLFGREPLADIDPEEVVALGAAVQANQLAGSVVTDEVLLLDVIPLSLGIEVGGGVVDKILPRNTATPASARATYTTQEDNQTGFVVHVVQGERELAADCRSLATFTLGGIPPMPAGLARLEITFRVDENGMLGVHAVEATTGLEQTVTVEPSFGLDDDTVEQMLIDALDHGEDDLDARKLAEQRVEGRRILAATRRAMADSPDLLDASERAAVEAVAAKLEKAIEGTDAARITLYIDDLDAATKPFAARRMNEAVAAALRGRDVTSVEVEVAHAKGIENAHADG